MEIAETAVFTRQVHALLDPESYRFLQLELADRPDRGPVIHGSGGLRKMLLAYAKGDQEDLTTDQLKILRRVVKEEFR